MSQIPQGVNLEHTSFAQKEPYKPPTMPFFGNKEKQKKVHHIIGGDFAEDENQTAPVSKPQTQHIQDITPPLNGNEINQSNSKPKFEWIKKNKGPAKQENSQINSNGIFEFSEIRLEK